MDKLSGMFHQETGQQYSGDSMQSEMMAKLISSKLGFNVPPSLLSKLCVLPPLLQPSKTFMTLFLAEFLALLSYM